MLVGPLSLGGVEMPIVLLLSCQAWAWNHLQDTSSPVVPDMPHNHFFLLGVART